MNGKSLYKLTLFDFEARLCIWKSLCFHILRGRVPDAMLASPNEKHLIVAHIDEF